MLGEHNASIFERYLGYTPPRIIDLETSGVLITRHTDCSPLKAVADTQVLCSHSVHLDPGAVMLLRFLFCKLASTGLPGLEQMSDMAMGPNSSTASERKGPFC
jgi:hypothetical protein